MLEQKQALTVVCDLLSNVTQSTRTRKSAKVKSETKTAECQFPNEDESLFYKYEQHTNAMMFDTESLQAMADSSQALALLINGIVSTVVIDDQRISRSLSDGAFEIKHGDSAEIIIDVKTALEKKSNKQPDEQKVIKQAKQLSQSQKVALMNEMLKETGFKSIEEFEAAQ